MTKPMELYQAGQLDEAIEQALSVVKTHPSDTTARVQLVDLCAIAGQWERADRQLDTIQNQDPAAAVGVALIRQLIRAELARHECFQQGRLPELIGEPAEHIRLHLRAIASLRAGDAAEAVQLLAEAAEKTPPCQATVNGQAAPDLRDLDDLTAAILEVHTSTGKYYWIDWRQVAQLEVHPPKRPRDLLWRQATLTVIDGPEGEVYLPAIYPATYADGTDASLRLGRSTDWMEGEAGLCRGTGQKMLLVAGEALPLMQLETVSLPDAS